jgi:hypothetical protein
MPTQVSGRPLAEPWAFLRFASLRSTSITKIRRHEQTLAAHKAAFGKRVSAVSQRSPGVAQSRLLVRCNGLGVCARVAVAVDGPAQCRVEVSANADTPRAFRAHKRSSQRETAGFALCDRLH